MTWICCHLGAREHYAVPRGVQRMGELHAMITDAWVRPGSLPSVLPGEAGRRLRERYHPELAASRVVHFTGALVANELSWRTRALSGWPLAMERNRWFEQGAANALDHEMAAGRVVFAHSYVALDVFKAAKARGCVTVLGQIDPGPEHMVITRQLAAQRPEYGAAPEAPPQVYYDRWFEECALADRIVVNSEWSKTALQRAGIPAAKLTVVPLPYEPEPHGEWARSFPDAFSNERPLRVLFVGTASVTKGVPELLDAIRGLQDLPVRLELVGDRAMHVPDAVRDASRITWTGAVPRSVVMERYRANDVLVFPSHSDGFGMAQVEARAWGLPIVASRHCGSVVVDGQTGWLLPEVSASAIETVLREIAAAPERLRLFSNAMRSTAAFTIEQFGRAMTDLVQ